MSAWCHTALDWYQSLKHTQHVFISTNFIQVKMSYQQFLTPMAFLYINVYFITFYKLIPSRDVPYLKRLTLL